MVKNYYVPKDKQGVVKEAEKLFKPISPVIIAGLESAIIKKKEALQFNEYIIDDAGLSIKLIGIKLFTYTSNNVQTNPLKEEDGLVAHLEIAGYMTRSRRLFAVIKDISNKDKITSRLRELSHLLEYFRSSRSRDIRYVDPEDHFDYPKEFFNGIRDAIRKSEGFENFFTID